VFPLLVLLFIALPIAELYVIIQIGGAIGVVPTLALLIADSLLGAALARSQSRAAWERFNTALAAGRVPGREVFDGAMIILGGALLLTPGFITDIFGLVLLIPPTRALIRGLLARAVKRRGGVAWRVSEFGGAAGPGPAAPGGRPGWPPSRRERTYDYEGTAREVPDAELPSAQESDRGPRSG
jgi:UPF0716 protein FxsA